MPECKVAIAAQVGLHARPAARFVKAAGGCGCDVRIGRPEEQDVDAKSILAVLSLGVGCGEEVVVSTEGSAATAALDMLVGILRRGDDEPATP